eukprot:CAMPEP_0184870600 /NCGR_PEP_ID=MMETSP0580-20130426/38069_1 /TAXON_ID=1118495 /ORGANISM="Dactyliosolen fragilissimus" /LENGTH=93 /DNA_ID=CAMNT_0027372761 /DNA_START=88 /DNA_END=366 /DNA_ORIENTATION=+
MGYVTERKNQYKTTEVIPTSPNAENNFAFGCDLKRPNPNKKIKLDSKNFGKMNVLTGNVSRANFTIGDNEEVEVNLKHNAKVAFQKMHQLKSK